MYNIVQKKFNIKGKLYWCIILMWGALPIKRLGVIYNNKECYVYRLKYNEIAKLIFYRLDIVNIPNFIYLKIFFFSYFYFNKNLKEL
jgi:hypothetical protein